LLLFLNVMWLAEK